MLSATIDRYAKGSLVPRTDRRVTIESVDFKTTHEMTLDSEILYDGSLDLIKAAVRRFGREGTDGYDLVLRSSAPPGSGLGSSSTMMVALTGLLAEHYGVPMGEYETAQLACAIEREDLGIAGGMQDMYAATFGGFNFIEFTDRVIVNPLRIRDATAFELEMSLLLCYTGITRDSARVIEDQTRRATTGSEDTLAGLRAQKELAVAMKAALLTGKLNDFGAMMGEAWTQKKRMSPYITNERIDELYDVAMHNGALGGKLTGAVVVATSSARGQKATPHRSSRVRRGHHHRIRFREQRIDNMAGVSMSDVVTPSVQLVTERLADTIAVKQQMLQGAFAAQAVEVAQAMISSLRSGGR